MELQTTCVGIQTSLALFIGRLDTISRRKIKKQNLTKEAAVLAVLARRLLQVQAREKEEDKSFYFQKAYKTLFI